MAKKIKSTKLTYFKDMPEHIQKKVLANQKKAKAKKIDHKKMWEGMPEFMQESAQPLKKIIVGFASQEDMLRFSKLVGQEITPKTRSIWYPPLVHKPIYNKRWSDKKKRPDSSERRKLIGEAFNVGKQMRKKK